MQLARFEMRRTIGSTTCRWGTKLTVIDRSSGIGEVEVQL